MNAWWARFSLKLGDVLLGWTLSMPRDLAVILMAMLLAALVLGVRRLLVERDGLMQTRADLHRLRELIRRSRGPDRSEAYARHRRNRIRVTWTKLKMELPAAAVSSVLLAALLTWGSGRLDRLPPRVGDEIRLELSAPASAAGEIAHVVPQPGIEAIGGWVRILKRATRDQREARATWTLRAEAGPMQGDITIRLGSRTAVHPIAIGTGKYPAPVKVHEQLGTTTLHISPYRPFGVSTPLDRFGLPGWLALFLLVFVPAYLVGGRLLFA